MDRLGRDRNARHRTALTADGHSAGFPPSLRTPDHIACAEELGYRRAWCYDAPAVFAGIWMTLARAVDRTRRIGLGTAVVIPDYRHLMTTAAAVAGQAPGRVAVGLGPGRAQIMHGGKPGLWRDLDAHVVALRALLRGKQVEGNGTPNQLIHPDGVVAARPVEVPILLSSEGPKGLEIARRVADGVNCFGQARPGFAWNASCCTAPSYRAGRWKRTTSWPPRGGRGAAHLITYAGGGDAVDRLPDDGAQYRASIERELTAFPRMAGIGGSHD